MLHNQSHRVDTKFCCFFILFKEKGKETDKRLADVRVNYRNTVGSLMLGNGIFCTSLLILSSVDTAYRNKYVYNDTLWHGSFVCFMIAAFHVTSNFITIFWANLLCVSRYYIVKYPLDSWFARKTFIRIIIITTITVSILLATGFSIIHWFPRPGNVSVNRICYLIGCIDRSPIPILIHLLILVINLSSVISIPSIFVLLYIELKRQKIALGEEKSDQDRGIDKGNLISLANLLTWIPASGFFILSFLWHHYLYEILLWSVVLLLPSNTILDPIIFVFLKRLRKAKTSCHSTAKHGKWKNLVKGTLKQPTWY